MSETDSEGEYIIDSDILDEISIDDEDLPDASDDEIGDFTYEDVEISTNAQSGGDSSVQRFPGRGGSVFAISCSPTDATLVASGGQDHNAFYWRIGQRDWHNELMGHEDSVSCLSFSNDGQFLASGGLDGTVRIWDTLGNLKYTFRGPDECNEFEWVRWHPSGHLVLAGCTDSTTWMWNARKNALLKVFCGHGKCVTCGDFTPDGNTICTGSEDGTLRIWNPRTGKSIHVVRGYPCDSSAITCLTISSDSTCALTGTDYGALNVVNITTGKVVSSVAAHLDSILCLGLSPGMPWVATGGKDQKLEIWDLQHSASRSSCEHEGAVICLKWLGASRYVASGCSDGQIVIWDARSGECVRTLRGHSDTIHSLSLSANGNFLVSASADGTAWVFDISEFK